LKKETCRQVQQIGFSTFLKIGTFGQCLHKIHAKSRNKYAEYGKSGTHFRRIDLVGKCKFFIKAMVGALFFFKDALQLEQK
jgi:hypothetical protein